MSTEVLTRFRPNQLAIPRPQPSKIPPAQNLVKEYVRQVRVVAAGEQEINAFLAAIYKSNNFSDRPTVSLRIEDGLTPEILSQPQCEMYESLSANLTSNLDQLFRAFETKLNEGRRQHRIGEIILHPNRVCEYVWFMEKSMVQSLGRVGDNLMFERTIDLVGFYHVMTDYRIHQMPAANTSKPRRVSELLASTPSWLRHLITIVDGTLVKEVQLVKAMRNEQYAEYSPIPRPVQPLPTYVYDPAVCFGSPITGQMYVLTGWNPNER